jgi:hypothetical protein
MNKIKVEISIGTYSYIMGGAQLLEALKNLEPSVSELFDLVPVISIANCNEDTGHKPPYVSVNGNPLEEATLASVLAAVRREIK